MDFDDIIAPLDRATFLSGYWEKTWLHQTGSPGRFAGLMPWEELNALLQNTRLAPPLIKLSQDGVTIDAERYIHTAPGAGNLPRIDVGRMTMLLAEGATLILNMVGDVSPGIRTLSQSVDDALSARNYVNLYAGWKSQKGFDLHWDAHEVLVLQIHGRKRWQIFAPTQDHPLDAGVPPKPTGAPVWDGMLNAGDILYLPRGWWHVAHPVNEPSLHLTIGISPLNGINLLNWLAGRLRLNSALARKNIPVLADNQTRAAHMAALRDLVAASLAETSIEEFFYEVADRQHGQPGLRLPQSPQEQLAPLNDASLILLASACRLSFRFDGEFVTFNAYGKSYRVPAFVQPALALLSDARAVSLADLGAALEHDLARSSLKDGLVMLARAGVVLVEKG